MIIFYSSGLQTRKRELGCWQWLDKWPVIMELRSKGANFGVATGTAKFPLISSTSQSVLNHSTRSFQSLSVQYGISSFQNCCSWMYVLIVSHHILYTFRIVWTSTVNWSTVRGLWFCKCLGFMLWLTNYVIPLTVSTIEICRYWSCWYNQAVSQAIPQCDPVNLH